jgi:hypothetical protein
MTLVRVRVIRPFAWLGRIAGGGERLRMHPEDFERWAASGHVEAVEGDAPAVLLVEPARWAQPVER